MQMNVWINTVLYCTLWCAREHFHCTTLLMMVTQINHFSYRNRLNQDAISERIATKKLCTDTVISCLHPYGSWTGREMSSCQGFVSDSVCTLSQVSGGRATLMSQSGYPVSPSVVWKQVTSISQNHRMDRIGRDHSRSSNPTSLLKQPQPRAHGTGLHPHSPWMSPVRGPPQQPQNQSQKP